MVRRLVNGSSGVPAMKLPITMIVPAVSETSIRAISKVPQMVMDFTETFGTSRTYTSPAGMMTSVVVSGNSPPQVVGSDQFRALQGESKATQMKIRRDKYFIRD